MKSDLELATLFAAFAHPSRIAVLRVLLPHAISGRTFGDLATALSISPSTLTHHLREMESAGVVHREIIGRSTMVRLNADILNTALTQLTQLCCCFEDQPNHREPNHQENVK